jgi:hypothetical protein
VMRSRHSLLGAHPGPVRPLTDPVSLLREVRQSLASRAGCDCEACDLVTRIDEALRLADEQAQRALDNSSGPQNG